VKIGDNSLVRQESRSAVKKMNKSRMTPRPSARVIARNRMIIYLPKQVSVS
jgi:hypothetical protein